MKQYLSLAIFILGGIVSLSARHLIGGEVTYECLGNDEYRISIRVYRDCFSGGACFDGDLNCENTLEGTVSVYRGTQLFIPTIIMPPPRISPIEPDLDNPCLLVPQNVCVEQGIYTFTVNLPQSTQPYTVSYTRCCRNETISNILTPGEEGATYTTEITAEAQEVCNTSPVFNSFPPIVICSGEKLSFDHSATDVDGDSLVYKTFNPFSGGGQLGLQGAGNFQDTFDGLAPNPEQPPPYPSVTFAAGFSNASPLPSNPAFSLDLNTGLLELTPTVNGQYVVGIMVEEYREGVLLSRVHRDFQFNVTTCEPLVFADIEKDSVTAGGQYQINACGESDVSFINQSYNRANIVENYWEFDLTGDGPQRYNSWDLSLTFPDTGRFEGRLILNPGLTCGDTADIAVNIFPSIEADFEFQDSLCLNQDIPFTNLSVSEAVGGIRQSNWQFGNILSSNEFSPTIRFPTAGSFAVSLEVSDINNCRDEITKPLSYFPLPLSLSLDNITADSCAPVVITMAQFDTFYTDDYNFQWDFGDGTSSDARVPTHSYTEPGNYFVSLDVTSPNNCTLESQSNTPILVVPNATAGFIADRLEAPSYQPVFNFENTSQNAFRYEWQAGGTLYETEDLNYIASDTGQILVTLTAFNNSGCVDTAATFIYIKPQARVFLPNAFVPQSNTVNNLFRPKGEFEFLTTYKLQIYDRFGRLLFESEDQNEGWNGTYKEELLPAGVYVYLLEYKDLSGETYIERGYATLVK